MSESEKNRDDFGQEDQTRIYVPGRDRESGNPDGMSPTSDQETQTGAAEQYDPEVPAPEQPEDPDRDDMDAAGGRTVQPDSFGQDTVFCMSCGAKNKAGSKFCVRCGQPLDQAPEASYDQNNSAQSYYNQNQNSSRPSGYQSQNGPRLSGYQNQNGPQPSGYQNQNGPRPSGYQDNGPYPQGNGYQANSGYGGYYQPGAGSAPSQQQYGNGPQYQPYQNGPARGYYPNGNQRQRYGSGNGYNGYPAKKGASLEIVLKSVFTVLITISLLFALFGRIVNKTAAMSLVTNGISSYFPNALSGLEDYFNLTDSEASDLYSDLNAVVRYLGKDGYSAIDLAGMDRALARTADSLEKAEDTVSSFSDSDDDTDDAVEGLQRYANIGFFMELILILVTSLFSAFSVYTIWKSKNVSKRRGVICILAGIDLVFLIAHLVAVGLVNSAFKQIILDMGSWSFYSSYSGMDLGKVFSASVGVLLLPLIFTAAAIVIDVVASRRNV